MKREPAESRDRIRATADAKGPRLKAAGGISFRGALPYRRDTVVRPSPTDGRQAMPAVRRRQLIGYAVVKPFDPSSLDYVAHP